MEQIYNARGTIENKGLNSTGQPTTKTPKTGKLQTFKHRN